jgi:glycosyltransferase involved in cell wall biosynthesis
MSRTPRVSVIVTAFNREAMIGDAIASVLAQTMADFELIVVDDGSTDRTVDVVRAIDDPRIRLIAHGRNRGTQHARNSGLEAAAGRYVAWLDSDDLARPRRLEIEADYLDANPDIAMVGSAAGTIRADGRRSWLPRARPASHEQIAALLLFRSALLQSSIMGRAEILQRYPYRDEFPVCQDLDLFIRLVRDHRVANLTQLLVDRRMHAGQAVNRRAAMIVEKKRLLLGEQLCALGIDPDPEDLDRHILLGRTRGTPLSKEFLDWSEQWLTNILAANRSRQVYDGEGLEHAVGFIWRRACLAALRGGHPLGAVARAFRRPSVSKT